MEFVTSEVGCFLDSIPKSLSRKFDGCARARWRPDLALLVKQKEKMENQMYAAPRYDKRTKKNKKKLALRSERRKQFDCFTFCLVMDGGGGVGGWFEPGAERRG